MRLLKPYCVFYCPIIWMFHSRAGGLQSEGAMEYEKYCQPPWLADKKNFRILDALEWLTQKYFDLGDNLLIVSALKPFLFAFVSLFSFCFAKKWGGGGGHSLRAPSPTPVLPALYSHSLNNKINRLYEPCSRIIYSRQIS